MEIEILKDLLPSYIDGITSSASNQLIEQELKHNSELRQYYETMLADLELKNETTPHDIDSLKKIRRVTRKKILLGILGTLATVFVLSYAFFWYYNKSWTATSQDIIQSTTNTQGTVTLTFTDKENREGVQTLVLQQPDYDLQDGYQSKVTIKQSRINPLNSQLINSTTANTIRFTFVDKDTILLNDQKLKVGNKDTLEVQYQDKTEKIKIQDLFENSK